MSATTNNADITREMLELLSPNAVRKLARDRFGMTMPFAWKRDELVSAVLDQVAPDEQETETPTPTEADRAWAANVIAGAMENADRMENEPDAFVAVFGNTTTLDPKPVTDEPTAPVDSGKRTREDVSARLAAHRERLAREAAEREIENAAKQKKNQRWEPTSDELNKRASKLAFSIGSLVSAHARIAKESAILRSVLTAMGELASGETLELAKQSMIEGYSYAQQRTCFPSAALSSTLSGDALRDAVWTELVAVGIPVLINGSLALTEDEDADTESE